MPELALTDEQLERLRDVCGDLEAAYVGPYGQVRPEDAVDYLLDTYTPPESLDGDDADAKSATVDDGTAGETETETDAGSETETENGNTSDSPADTLQQAMSLLEAHDDKWGDGSGDEPYEVSLPDGSTEPARTKDDVRRLLFKHYR